MQFFVVLIIKVLNRAYLYGFCVNKGGFVSVIDGSFVEVLLQGLYYWRLFSQNTHIKK